MPADCGADSELFINNTQTGHAQGLHCAHRFVQ